MGDMTEIEELRVVINQNVELQKKFEKLTSHLIQAIIRLDERIPQDRMDKFSDLLQKPLTIDDKRFQTTLQAFQQEMKKIEGMDMLNALSEVKFIGKRLIEVENKLEALLSAGVIHNIDLQFKVDGYKLVKQPISYDKEEAVVPGYFEEEQVLEGFTEREKLVVKRRLGICGFEKETFTKIAKDYDLSPTRISNIFNKTIRRLALSDNSKIKKSINSLGKTHPLCMAIKQYFR